jgi:hypothetical protein
MREKLIELLEEAPIYWDEINGLDRERIADHLIANGVTVQKKGEWELHGNDDDCGCSYFCSKCGANFDEDFFDKKGEYCFWLHCPRCGADMRGDSNA